jgi:hypothetical protein
LRLPSVNEGGRFIAEDSAVTLKTHFPRDWVKVTFFGIWRMSVFLQGNTFL